MKKRTIFGVTTGLFFVWIIAGFFFLRADIERIVFERLINEGSRIFFADSVRVEKVTIDRHFKLQLKGISGSFQARQGPVPLEVKSVESQEPLYFLLSPKPVKFVFKGVRPKGSLHEGLFGEILVKSGKDWRIEFWADFQNTNLEDLQWLDPENLGGVSGALSGRLTCVQAAGLEPAIELNVVVPKPGGKVQARFFDLFLPYLPGSVQKERVVKLVSENKQLVRYQMGELKMSLPQSDRMKIFLRILVLDYNLNLTLNMTIRTDQKEGLLQIARLMGLVEAKVS